MECTDGSRNGRKDTARKRSSEAAELCEREGVYVGIKLKGKWGMMEGEYGATDGKRGKRGDVIIDKRRKGEISKRRWLMSERDGVESGIGLKGDKI